MADITSYFTSSSGDGLGSDDADDIFTQIAAKSNSGDLTDVGVDSYADSTTVTDDLDLLWLPSVETAAVIDKVRLNRACLEEADVAAGRTVPVIYAEKQGDPVKDYLLAKNRVEALSQRSLSWPNISQFSKDMTGVKQLIKSGCYRSALNLTAELLAQSLTPSAEVAGAASMGGHGRKAREDHAMWGSRFALLVRLNMASIAEFEMQPFGNFDNPDLYHEFFAPPPTPLASGLHSSLVPFSSRLLHAQLPHFFQRNSEALDRLTRLVTTVRNIVHVLLADHKSASAVALWRQREKDTQLAVANVLVAMKSYREAAVVFDEVLQLDGDDVRNCRVAALAGRVFIQAGCLPLAEQYFSRAVEQAPSRLYGDLLTSLHGGYLAIAAGDMAAAASSFETAFKRLEAESSACCEDVEALKVQVVTCRAVAVMYCGQLQAAIDVLEAVLFAEPRVFAVESLLINLATMYELYQSNTAEARKLRLLDLVAEYCGDGFDLACLKLPSAAPNPAAAASATGPPPGVTAPSVQQNT